MRKINTRFFFLLLGAIVILGATLVVVRQLQASNIAAAMLFQANQAERQGHPDQAAKFLGRYLEFVPNDLEERARLATLLADPALATTPRARSRARFVIEQVLTRDPQRHDLRQALCRLLLDAQQWEPAGEQIAILEKSLPDSGAVALLLGEWQERREQQAQAIASYRRALQLAPDQADAYTRLAALLRRDRKKGASAKEIDSLVTTALLKAPNDVGVRVLAAELANDQGDTVAAQAHLDHAMQVQPRDGRVFQALARLQNHAGERAKARETLRKGLRTTGKQQRFELLWSLANLLLDDGDLPEARKILAEIRETRSTPVAEEYLEARCRMVQGRWYEASRMLEKIRPNLKSVPELAIQADLFLGTCYEQLDEPTQQLAAFKRVVEQDPFSADARKGLASAQWQLGQSGEAIRQYEQLAEQTGKVKDQTKRKVELARVLLLDLAQRDSKDWSPFERILAEMERDHPGDPDVALLRAESNFARGRKEQAEEALAKALKDHPRHAELWLAKAGVALRNGKRDQAKECLDAALECGSDSIEVRLAMIQFWADQPVADAARGLKAAEEKLDRLKTDEQTRLRFILAEAYQQAGAYADAERHLREIAALPRHAEDVRVRLMLFELALLQDDEPAMLKLVAEIQGIEGQEGASWRHAEAQRLVRLGRKGQADTLERARTLLTEAAAQRPDWHGISLVRAEIDELQNKTEQALANLRRAIDQGARTARTTRQLVLLLLRSQRFDEADQEMRKLQSQAPLAGDMQRLAVAVSLNKKDYQKAEALARQSLAAGSSDFREYLWIGHVLANRDVARADADKAFRRAVSLAEKVPETWVALVRFLVATDQHDAARAELANARTHIAPEQVDLALALCHDALGETENARDHFILALKAQPSSVPLRRVAGFFFLHARLSAEAEAVLRPIVEAKLPASEEDLTWAKRLLALTLASMGDPRRQAESLALVGVTVDGHGNPVEENEGALEDQRYRAKVLAMQNRRACRDRAIELCESLLGRQALSPEDQFLLAQLYVRQGPDEAWDRKARALLKTLTKNQPNEPRYLVYYAHRLLHKNDVAGAEEVVARLEQLEKTRKVPAGSLGSVELKARVLEKRGRGDEAVALLVGFAGEDKAPAERLFAVAQLQGRLGNLAEAIDLCERAAKTLPAEVAFGSAVAILRAHRSFDEPTPAWLEQWTRMEKTLRQLIKNNDRNLAFYLQLADLYHMKGDVRELETVCRQVLEIEPENLVTLNNLAWHIAPQAGRTDEALDLIGRAIAKYGQRPELLDTRAFVYLNRNDGAKALADLNEAVKENPTAIRFFHLTRAHQLTKNPGEALAALEQANTLGLSIQRLHPAERDIYRQITAELKPK